MAGGSYFYFFALIHKIPFGERQAILLVSAAAWFNYWYNSVPQDLKRYSPSIYDCGVWLVLHNHLLRASLVWLFIPQTVWTFMYIWFEEKLEGAANKRKKRIQTNSPPIWRLGETLKHIAWWAIAIATGLTFVGYFIPIKELVVGFFTFNSTFCEHFGYCSSRVVLMLTRVGCARWFVCTCVRMRVSNRLCSTKIPSLLAITPSVVKAVVLVHVKWTTNNSAGDCIDCNLCVQVCPTGIDIRGLQ